MKFITVYTILRDANTRYWVYFVLNYIMMSCDVIRVTLEQILAMHRGQDGGGQDIDKVW